MIRFFTFLTLAFVPSLAFAHAGEQGFVLLLPTGLYSTGGVLAVVLSIALVSFVTGADVRRLFAPRLILPLPRRGLWGPIAGLMSTVVFFGCIAIGLLGPSNPVANLLPLTIWTLVWVLMVVLQGVFGDLWHWLNPWRALYTLLNPNAETFLTLPRKLGVWPAVLVILAVNLFVLADIAPNDPRRLAGFALGYWLFTFAGMMLFGGQIWLSRVEGFSVFFGWVADLSPFRTTQGIQIGLPGWRSLTTKDIDPSRAAFCLALLASGSFDGLNETFWWLAKIGVNPLEFPGRSATVWTSSVGLIAAYLLLCGVFCAAVWIGIALANRVGPLRQDHPLPMICALSISLLPIAFGYHIAHYMTAFLVQIQYVVLALNDPFDTGRTLLGLHDLHVTTGFLNTKATVRVIWLSQAAAVVLSHVLSVLMAHHITHRFYTNKQQATLAQVGIGVLMILYTIFGLWLLASPRGV